MNLTPQDRHGNKVVPVREQERNGDWQIVPQRSAGEQAGMLSTEVERVRSSTAATPSTRLRRLLFLWFRVYVYETKRDKEQRVNVAIPIPIPLIGALFDGRLAWKHALNLVKLMDDERANSAEAGRYLESCMAYELVRVEEEDEDRDKYQLVVVGLD